jgi:hypothetical protein
MQFRDQFFDFKQKRLPPDGDDAAVDGGRGFGRFRGREAREFKIRRLLRLRRFLFLGPSGRRSAQGFEFDTVLGLPAIPGPRSRKNLKSADYSDYADFFFRSIGALIFEGPNESLMLQALGSEVDEEASLTSACL